MGKPKLAGGRDVASLRLAQIVHRLVTDPRGWDADELKQELRIADRTLRKYQLLLRDHFAPFGAAFIVEREGDRTRLKLRAPAQAVTTPELVSRIAAQRLACDLLGFLGNGPGSELRAQADLARAEFLQGVVRRGGSGAVQRLLGDLDRILHVKPDAPKDYTAKGPVIATLLEAITYENPVAIDYRPSTAPPKRHEVEPLTLCLWRSGLYLFARYAGKSQPYVFVVDRIQSAERLPAHFRYPGRKDYSPAALVDGAFGMFVPRGDRRRRTRVDVVFEPVPWLQTYVREREWVAGQQVTDLRDGRMRLTFMVDALEEVVPWVRQWGTACTVEGPPELRKAMASGATPDGRPTTSGPGSRPRPSRARGSRGRSSS